MMMIKYRIKKLFRAVRKFIGKYFVKFAVVFCILFGCFYLVNDVIYGRLIWENAYKMHKMGNCEKSIELYNHTIKYLSFLDFLPQNKKKYIAVQHRIALCYLELDQPEKAEASIKSGMYLMMDTYGLNSTEYAQYIRKHVIDYYIKKGDFNTAKSYLSLAQYFYMKLKTKGLEIAYINKLNGDLYEAIGYKHIAKQYYTNAYRLAENVKSAVDPDELINICDSVAKLYLQAGNYKQAVLVYSKLIDRLQAQKCKDKTKYAYVHWKLGNVYAAEGKHELAIMHYNTAHDAIEKMPGYYTLKQDVNALRADMIVTCKKLNRYSTVEKLEKLMQK